jgi:hypothetical protein
VSGWLFSGGYRLHGGSIRAKPDVTKRLAFVTVMKGNETFNRGDSSLAVSKNALARENCVVTIFSITFMTLALFRKTQEAKNAVVFKFLYLRRDDV